MAKRVPAVRRQVVPRPPVRRLRVFALDPIFTAKFESAVLNQVTLAIPWEDDLRPGPAGDYIAVADHNPAGRLRFDPVDLNGPEILAIDGLTPTDGNPQFRQQMVYAVAMRTIHNFERALGRPIHWSQQRVDGTPYVRYRRQLKAYPHYQEMTNAYYDSSRGLCFGYFAGEAGSSFAGTSVFTCLSQDVIAREVVLALLHGMSMWIPGHAESEDGQAITSAFADLIPLLQHFWQSDVLRAQMAEIRGDLHARSALGAVAPQFGAAIGRPDGIRNALGYTDKAGNWCRRTPDPTAYQSATESHVRGDVLVAAIFEAFRKIYEARVSDLRRIASGGTGLLREGTLHPDLVGRFTEEVAKSAQHVLDICIRSLDYLPPLEMSAGDLLRAIITGDYDLELEDSRHYRIAFIDAFRSYGIFPHDVTTLSQDTLLWPKPERGTEKAIREFLAPIQRGYWNLTRDRARQWGIQNRFRLGLKDFLVSRSASQGKLSSVNLREPFEVVSFDPRTRGSSSGNLVTQWVIKVVQSDGVAGCTLIVDAESGMIQRVIRTNPRTRRKRTRLIELPKEVSAEGPPIDRKLRVFAFDPSMSLDLDVVGVNEVTLRVPWERKGDKDILEEGPVGEYLEVVDHDPASNCYYEPIDLNDPFLLAQNGLAPSEGQPQFHQQMVYAVAMQTIRNFERILGRVAVWSPRAYLDPIGRELTNDEQYVQRLRIYPHVLREANAYYSPDKKAILFGYFAASGGGLDPQPTSAMVFTCLSHDIVAHEVTHALLDGMHHRFIEPSNPDVLAFHEAFADIVALFQHFSLPDVLRHQIAATRGDLASQNRLGELAQQFGHAIGRRGALRNAIGSVDVATGDWKTSTPNPNDYSTIMEPHERGAILVGAVFDAFLTIYKSQIGDLLRIATEGTGVLPTGQLHPDLVNRLAEEAAKASRYVLQMCIRALDYCPPIDITFGEYLRAIVTADYDFDPVDPRHRRVAFVDAFKRRGILPPGVRSLSVDALLWRSVAEAADEDENTIVDVVRGWAADIAAWGISRDRKALYELMINKRAQLHEALRRSGTSNRRVLGRIDLTQTFEVHAVHPSIWSDHEGKPRFQWVIELMQRVPQYFDPASAQQSSNGANAKPDYYFRVGATLVVDAETGAVRYSIKKPPSQARMQSEWKYRTNESVASLAGTYLGDQDSEPFAMLHRF